MFCLVRSCFLYARPIFVVCCVVISARCVFGIFLLFFLFCQNALRPPRKSPRTQASADDDRGGVLSSTRTRSHANVRNAALSPFPSCYYNPPHFKTLSSASAVPPIRKEHTRAHIHIHVHHSHTH